MGEKTPSFPILYHFSALVWEKTSMYNVQIAMYNATFYSGFNGDSRYGFESKAFLY